MKFFNRLFKNRELIAKKIPCRRLSERVLFKSFISTESSWGITYTSSGNLSSTGIFLESRVPFEIDSILSLNFFLPEFDYWMNIKGKVANIMLSEDGVEMGLGIQFIDLTLLQKKMIQEYVEMHVIEKWFDKKTTHK